MLLALESAAMTVQLRDRDVIDLARLRAWAVEWDDEGERRPLLGISIRDVD